MCTFDPTNVRSPTVAPLSIQLPAPTQLSSPTRACASTYAVASMNADSATRAEGDTSPLPFACLLYLMIAPVSSSSSSIIRAIASSFEFESIHDHWINTR